MDHSTPNLPSRDFDKTRAFYATIGFETVFQDAGWMVLKRDSVMLEFFPHPELQPLESWFCCCLRLDDIEAFLAICEAAGIEAKNDGSPRVHHPHVQRGMKIGALIDIDGTLLRLVEN